PRLVTDDPAANHRVIAVEHWHDSQLLQDKTLVAIESSIAVNHCAAINEQDILALAGIKRFLGVAPFQSRTSRVVLKIGRQEIGMAWRHLPEQRQDTFVRQDGLPGWFDETRCAHGRRAAERVRKHPLPRVELEQKAD